jgi:hypothetical protein
MLHAGRRAQGDGYSRRVSAGVVLIHDWEELSMDGWLMWGLILPLLLVVAGIVTFRRRNHRP